MFDLQDNVVLVTGAAGGLGAAISAGVAAQGADVVLVDVDEAGLAHVAESVEATGRRAMSVTADASSRAAVEAIVREGAEKFGGIDVLINLAYTPTFGAPEDLSDEDWDRAFRVNVTSYFLFCQLVGRQMIKQGRGGSIVNMCSIAGTSAVGRGSFPYSVSKGAIVMLTKELALEWASHGIRVNAIQPCQFRTPGLQHRLDNPHLASIEQKFLSGIPLNRLGDPSEMVGPVVFLASKASSMVTGVLLPVDGGNLAMNAGGTKG